MQVISALDIGYIVKNSGNLGDNEIAVKNILINNDYSVDVLDDKVFDADNYDLIIVSDSVGKTKDIFDNTQHKTLFLSRIASKNAGLSISSGFTDSKKIKIIENNNPITKDFEEDYLNIYNKQSKIQSLIHCFPINSENLAVRPSSNTKSVLLALEKGSLLIDDINCKKRNTKIEQRNLFFGLSEAKEWNSNAETLFLNSVKWIINGGDNDGDGYYENEDCNDNDFNVHPNAEDLDKNCVNDAPVIENINNPVIYETETAEIIINAVDFEEDDIVYSINSDKFIQDSVNKNVFRWNTDYEDYGDYVFEAKVSDGLLSNKINFEVEIKNKNQKPVCQDIPDLEWNEDEIFSLNLNNYCSDPDGDYLMYAVENTSLDANISLESLENGIALFSSQENWFGNDWIIFKTGDGKNQIFTNKINLNIVNVNDLPELNNFFPAKDNNGIVKIIENTTKKFEVDAFDIDGDDLGIKWFVDEINVGTGNVYFFNKEIGDYQVKAVVSDNKSSIENLWNVKVRNINEFTCSEASGNVCSSEEVCLGNILDVSDSINCCSVQCSEKPPEFKLIKRNGELKKEIKITIKKPYNNDEFNMLDKINVNLDIENNLSKYKNFDVFVYLYDVTKDKIIEKTKSSLSLNKNQKKNSDFGIIIPENLNENDDYYIFVKVSDKNYYNENYVKLNINREEHNVFIYDIIANPNKTICGNYVNVKVKLKNIGDSDENVYLTLFNSELGINEKTEEFKLERYSKKDEISKEFNFRIDDYAETGDYKIKTDLFFDNKKNSRNTGIKVTGCKKEKISETKSEVIKVKGFKSPFIDNSFLNKWIIVLIVVFTLIFFRIIGYVIFKII